MNVCMMLVMLCCVYGVASFFYVVCNRREQSVTGTQALCLSVIGIIGVQAFASMAGRLIPYMMSVSAGFLLLLGAYGHVLLIRRAVRLEGRSVRFNADGKTVLSAFYSPAMLCAGAAFLLSLILMRGMLVYRYDDLKQWGSAAKWLTEQESLPHNEDFAGYLNHYLTPTFFTSFFAIPVKWATGKLVEYDLYAANTLFFSVGLSLPLGEFGWKHAKRVFGMFWLMFFGVTALYYHSIANLYVDVTFSAWVGGIIGFLLLRRRLKGRFTGKSYAFVLLLSAFTVFIKWGYGILGVLLILAAWGILEYAARAELAARVNKILRSRRFWLMLGIGAAALLFALWLLSLIFGDALNRILPGAGGIVTALFDVLFARTEKAALTTQACLSGFFTQVATRGSFGYGTLPAFALLTLLGYFQSSRLESKNLARQMRLLHTAWAIGFFGWTLLILLTYVSTFAFAEATIALSFNRYVGLYLMIGYFVQVILLFLPEEYTAARKIVEGKVEFVPAKKSRGVDRRTLAQVLLVLVLLLNTNADLITESSGWNPDGIVGYGHVAAVQQQSATVKKLTGADDPILFIAQSGAERSLHRARFDVGMNVSGYKPNTYHFSADADAGYDLSVIRAPEELPQLIADGGYRYVWVYKTDAELNDFTASYYGMRLKSGTLYRVTGNGLTRIAKL